MGPCGITRPGSKPAAPGPMNHPEGAARPGWVGTGGGQGGEQGEGETRGTGTSSAGETQFGGRGWSCRAGGRFGGSQGHFSERARGGKVSREACRSATTHSTAPVIPVPPKPAWLQDLPLSPCIGNGGGGSRKHCFSHPTPPKGNPCSKPRRRGAPEGEMGKGGQSRAQPRASDKQRGKLGQV